MAAWLAVVVISGLPPPPLHAPSLAGGVFRWPAPDGGGVACLVFAGTDCPISNAYAPEVGRLAREYGPRGVTFAVVYPSPEATREEVAKHAREFGFPCPAVHDKGLTLARRVGARVVPEAVVLGPDGAVLYRGRVDDRYPAAGGRRREHPTTRDLRDALDAALAGKPAPRPWPRAVGCDIDFDAVK